MSRISAKVSPESNRHAVHPFTVDRELPAVDAGDDVVEFSKSVFDGTWFSVTTYSGSDSITIGHCQSNAYCDLSLGSEDDEATLFGSKFNSTPISLQVDGGEGNDLLAGNQSTQLNGDLKLKAVEQVTGF